MPRPESDETAIRLEGNKAVVEKLVAEIQKIVKERENQVHDVVEVPPEKHRQLIGPGGETRRKLEAQLGVSIDVPRDSVQGPARSQIKISGAADKIPAAKEHIASLVRQVEGETMQVPRSLHHTIADNGRLFARLRRDHGIIVDHANQQPPPRSTSGTSTSRGEASLPLITDEDAGESHSWELVTGPSSSDLEGDIPWILRGSPESIAKARAQIEKALEKAQKNTCTGYLVLPDPSAYRLVIGTGGSQINSIRRETGCKIDVPQKREKGEAIVIAGEQDGVERARDLILEAAKGRY